MTAAGVILDCNKWGDHSKKAWDVLLRFKPNVNMRSDTGVPLIVKHAELGEVEKAQMLVRYLGPYESHNEITDKPIILPPPI